MPHTHTRIGLHIIWATKDYQPLIHESLEPLLYSHIKDVLSDHKTFLIAAGGMPDHIHLIINLNPEIALSHVIKSIKGESSHWINQNGLIDLKFAWQEGYAAYATSDSLLLRTIDFVQNQKAFHTKKCFIEEYNYLLMKHNFIPDNTNFL